MRTLYAKFVIYTIGIMSISFILTFITINTFYHQQFKNNNNEKNIKIAKNITHFIEHYQIESLDAYLTSIANSGYKLLLVDENKTQKFFGEPFRKENLSHEAIDHVLAGRSYHGMRDLPKETFVTGLFSDELANTIGVPFAYENNNYALFLRPNIKMLFTEVHYLLGGLLIGMGIISIIAMLIVAKMLINPLTKLQKATKKIGKEQFSVDLPTNRLDEIGKLAKSFKQMTTQLQKADQTRKQFISNVSHDFQTPLQNINGYIDLLNNDEPTQDERTYYLNIIQLEVRRLSSLTKQLLLLTSLDQLEKIVHKKNFSITKLIKNTIHTYHWLLHEKDLSLTFDADDIIFCGDPSLLENVFDNLLSNAIKYNKKFGEIEITLKENETSVFIKIKDRGIGIKKEHLPKLFDRFYRVDKARNKKIEGTGLGLAIVQQIVHLHDGTIHVQSEINKGTVFSVALPKT